VTSRVVYIVDDNDEFRESAVFWLQGAGYRIRAWADPREAIDALAARPAGEHACLLLDVRMPQMSGLDLHDVLHERGVDIPVVYMSGHADVPLAVRAMQKGAVTFIEKPFDDDTLGAALDRAFTPSVIPQSTTAGTTESDTADDAGVRAYLEREKSLTPRELEVLTMVSHGIYNKVIADRIGLSVKTVELYRARGFAKMRVRTVADLTRLMVSRRV
jgi:two-component system, LuxR family, response regulator FixJ